MSVFFSGREAERAIERVSLAVNQSARLRIPLRRQVVFQAAAEVLQEDRVVRYRLFRHGEPMSFRRVLNLWLTDQSFRRFYSDLLSESAFAAYRWETPGLTEQTINRLFEFVLINTPEFATRKTDVDSFASYFHSDAGGQGIVSFPNLRGDATLIVLSPLGSEDIYGHLAAFIRHGPTRQIDVMWQRIAQQTGDILKRRSVWLSTAGAGVAWLHVRLGSAPKYYSYAPYRKI